ncbi:MAG: hypothetical protein JWO06_814 [Bacteroidota bacterium]|nr:hypothetical protein [Bacteroidota bacterium]
MKKTLFTILVLALICQSHLNAQVSGNSQYAASPASANYLYNSQQNYATTSRGATTAAMITSNNDITVDVNGLMNILADNYVAVFNVVQVGETTEQTDEFMRNRIQRFKDELKKINVDAAGIKTDMLSFVPKYEFQAENRVFSKTYNEVPTGFEMQKNISVHFKNSEELDAIVSAAAVAEIYDLAKVDYFIPNLQNLRDSLRNKCLQYVKTKSKSYEVLGLKLDTLRKVMEDNFITTYPQTRYFSYRAFSRPSLGSIKKKSQVTTNDATQVNSKFYNQVDYDRYDLVINPLITEPVVQLSYSVSVKYFLKEEEKPKNNYYILTPNGEVKVFNPK